MLFSQLLNNSMRIFSSTSRSPFLLLLLLLLLPLPGFSLTGQLLDVSPDARTNALGSAASADANGSAAVFHNPAGLMTLTTLELAASFRNELEDVNSGSMIVAMPFMQAGVLGLSIFSLNAGILDLPDTENDPIAELDFIVSTTYATTLDPSLGIPFPLHLGVTAKYFHSTLVGDYTGQAVVGDIGMMTALFASRLGLGVTLKNFGSRITYDLESEALPTSIVCGAAWHGSLTPDFSYLALADYAQPLEEKPLILTGIEVQYRDFINLRAGYRFLHDTANLSAGFGIQLRPYTFDYTFLSGTLAAKHLITVRYTWIPVKVIPSTHAQQGIDYFKQGKLTEARQAWKTALQKNPDDPFAKKYVREFETLQTDWINQQADRAEQAFANEHFLESWELWQVLAKKDPNHFRVRTGIQKQKNAADRQVSTARTWFNRQAWNNTLSAVSHALKIIPRHPPALAMQEQVNTVMQRNRRNKNRFFNQIAAKIKKLSLQGKPRDALAIAKRTLTTSPKNSVLLKAKARIPEWSHQHALKLKSQRHYQAAMLLWKTLLKISPNFIPAKHQLKKTADFFQTHILAGQQKAEQAFSRKNYVIAITAWEKVYALDPESDVKKNLLITYEAQGILYYRDDNLDAALQLWKKALHLNPANSILIKNIKRAQNKKQFIKKLGWETSP